MALMSSKSSSDAAPISFCIAITVSICWIICPLKNPKLLNDSASGSDDSVALIGIRCLRISTNSFTSAFGVKVREASSK